MKPQVETRDRFEIIATAIEGNTGTVIVAHPEAEEVEATYDRIVDAGCWRSVWVRHRHIVETVRNGTPAGYSVHIKWTRDFAEHSADRHDFLTKAAAMAFAEEGNSAEVMSEVFVFDHRAGRTIWKWQSDGVAQWL